MSNNDLVTDKRAEKWVRQSLLLLIVSWPYCNVHETTHHALLVCAQVVSGGRVSDWHICSQRHRTKTL